MRKVPLVQGEFFHLYNRGVDKRVIFTKKQEYERFLAYMYLLNSPKEIRPTDFFRTHRADEVYQVDRGDPLIAIGAFCLMPNHFHIYATPLVKGGISKFMQRLQTAYTKYFNEKHARSGSLLSSTFKAEHAATDKHAKYLFSYIHLNPAKLIDKDWKTRGPKDWKKLKQYVEEYPYSSYKEYSSGEHYITNLSPFPHSLRNKEEINEHIDAWLTLKDTA
ncbi:MAG: transposase [Patescibacteria group bacterium]